MLRLSRSYIRIVRSDPFVKPTPPVLDASLYDEAYWATLLQNQSSHEVLWEHILKGLDNANIALWSLILLPGKYRQRRADAVYR